jgi:hypothetical protein
MNMEEELANLKRKVCELENEKVELKTKLKESETKLEESETKLEESETKLKESETKLEESENEVLVQSIGHLFQYGLPPLMKFMSAVKSQSSTSAYHQPAIIVIKPFVCIASIEDFVNCRVASSLKGFIKDGSLQYSSESDVQGFVKLLMNDVITAAGLSKRLCLFNEIAFNAMRPDIWVFEVIRDRALNIPIGNIEVKKSSNELTNKTSIGQLFDYLLQLRVHHGRNEVFGILTSYTGWRIVWLPDTQAAAECDRYDVGNAPLFTEEADSRFETTRILHGTEVIPFNDKMLLKMLVSVVFKMSQSTGKTRPLLGDGRIHVVLSENNYQWKQIPIELLYLKFPHGNTTNFVLLRDYRYGAEGRVWLACDMTGGLVVIKFLIESDHASSAAQRECDHWLSIYEQQARVVVLANRIAIIMPFAFPCRVKPGDTAEAYLEPSLSLWSYGLDGEVPDRSFLSDDVTMLSAVNVNGLADEAITTMVEKGHVHNDVHWRHVAALPVLSKDGTLEGFRGIFIDLSGVTSLTEKQMSGQDAKQFMLNQLLRQPTSSPTAAPSPC